LQPLTTEENATITDERTITVGNAVKSTKAITKTDEAPPLVRNQHRGSHNNILEGNHYYGGSQARTGKPPIASIDKSPIAAK
jgi:hypothetical protein